MAVWRFWYSAKHAAHLERLGAGRNTVFVNGERVEYTEATDTDEDSASCSTARGGNFDDYILLGDAPINSIECGRGTPEYEAEWDYLTRMY